MAEEDKKIETEETKHRPSEVGVENKIEAKPEKKEEPKAETPEAEPVVEKPVEIPKTETVQKKPEAVQGKEYIIPLRKRFNIAPRYNKTNKAVKAVKEFLVRHMKVYDRDLKKIKIDPHLNEFLWFRGIRKPPAKVKVKVTRDGDNIRAELVEMPNKIKFNKARLEKRDQKAMEFVDKKKKTLAEKLQKTEKPREKLEDKVEKSEEEKKEETRPSVAKLEEKVEEKEKAKAGEVAMQKMEKAAAKTAKHQTKISKEPKRQVRKALEK